MSRMHVPWTRGASSGGLLVVLGAWAGIVPFIGPYLDFAYTPATGTTWHWTDARGWFEVAPGAGAVVAGLLLFAATNRAVTIFGSWLGIAAGSWLIVGPSLAGVLNQTLGAPDPASTGNVQALEALFFFYGIGALILFVASTALGRLSVQSVRDVEAAERRAAKAEAQAATATAVATDERGAASMTDERRAASMTDERGAASMADEPRAASMTDEPRTEPARDGDTYPPTERRTE